MKTTSPKYRTKIRMSTGDNLVSCWPENRKSAAENGINQFIAEVWPARCQGSQHLSILESGTDAAYIKSRSLSPDALARARKARTSQRCKYIQPSTGM